MVMMASHGALVFGLWLLCLQFRALIMAWKIKREVTQTLKLLLLMWGTRKKLLAPGFNLAHAWSLEMKQQMEDLYLALSNSAFQMLNYV